MSRYTVELERDVRKALNAMRDMRLRDRIEAAILDLADDPRPPGVKKMVGHRDLWRIRVGEWRVVSRIEDGRLVVVVVAVGGRSGVHGVVKGVGFGAAFTAVVVGMNMHPTIRYLMLK